MNAKNRSSFIVGLVTCSALALTVGCAGDSDDGGNKPTGGATTSGANSVTFAEGKASGVLTGYGWIALGVLDTATSPTCGGTPITKNAPCTTTTTWNSKTALCVTGTIPKLPDSPLQKDYDDNWGIQIGMDAKETPGTIGKAYSSIDIAVSGSPTTGLRIVLQKDGETTGYCANYAGKPVLLSTFNTACWDGKGKSLTEFEKINKVGVQVSSESTEIAVANLCLNSITFN